MFTIKYISTGEFSEWDLKHLKATDGLVEGISNYKDGGYDGKGFLIARDEKGMFWKYDCGHCSCYGSLENGVGGIFSKEEILKVIDAMESYHATEAEKELFRLFVNGPIEEKETIEAFIDRRLIEVQGDWGIEQVGYEQAMEDVKNFLKK